MRRDLLPTFFTSKEVDCGPHEVCTFEIDESSLEKIGQRIKAVAPIYGRVNEANIYFTFASKEQARVFMKYLENDVLGKRLDFTRIRTEQNQDQYTVNILSKDNVKTMILLFDLSPRANTSFAHPK